MNVSKKLSILALAALLPAAAFAQADAAKPTVTVYGTFNLNMQSTDAGGATNPLLNVKSRMALSNDSSNVGVRAALKVSDMIGGVAQCETTAAVSGIGTSPICNRNSRIGLTGDWGTLFYGNWDTPYKAAAYGTKADDPFGNTDVYDAAGLLTSPGFNTTTGGYSTASNTTITRFTIRGQNSIAYHSPKFMGLSGKVQYVVDQFKNATSPTYQDPSLISVALNYEWTALSVFATYESHADGFGLVGIGAAGRFGATAANTAGTAAAPAHTTDTGLRVGAGYELGSPAGATTLGVVYEQLSYEQSSAVAGSIKKYSRNAYQVGLKHRYGDHEFRARYNMNDKGTATLVSGLASNTSGYGATMLTLGYAYYIAPALQVYGYYAKITNEVNASYTFGTGGAAAVAGATPVGADPSAFGLGARFAF